MTTSAPVIYPLNHFLSRQTPLLAEPSLTYRLVARPLWWAFAQLNPFGPSSDRVEKEDVLWKRFGKGREYVHMPTLEVRTFPAPRMGLILYSEPLQHSSPISKRTRFSHTLPHCIPRRPFERRLPRSAYLQRRRARRGE